MIRFIHWVFESNAPREPWWRLLLWWERRRIPYNIFVGAWGVVCLAICLFAIWAIGELQPGEDAIEPLALIAAPIAINIAYSKGFFAELVLRRWVPSIGDRPGLSVTLLKLGLA